MDRGFLSLYRPFADLTLALDCLFWHGNPFGYHLANLLYHVSATIFLFLLTKRLLREFGARDSSLAAFLASALFAAFPLHAEAVVWIVGRVDVICASFYLASFWLFVKSLQDNSRWALSASLAACLVSLFSKEMGATLPVVLTLYCLLIRSAELSWRETFRSSFRKVLPFWLAAALYLAIRGLVLGSFVGGYVGSAGQLFNESIVKRLFTSGWWLKVFYPLNEELFAAHYQKAGTLFASCLNSLYVMAGLMVLLRAAWCRWDRRAIKLMVLAGSWLLTAIAPMAQVWRLDFDLAGSRFFYLASAPLCLLIVLFFLPLGLSATRSSRERILRTTATVWLASLALLFAWITHFNNLSWLEAGDEMRDIRSAIEKECQTLRPGGKLVILNLPRLLHGAHMFYECETLEGLLRPPLCRQDLSEKVAVMEPVFLASEEFLNRSTLRRLADDPAHYAFFVWDRQAKRLRRLTVVFPRTEPAERLVLSVQKVPAASDGNAERYLIATEPAIQTAGVDFVELDLVSEPLDGRLSSERAPGRVTLCWEDGSGNCLNVSRATGAQLVMDGRAHTYRFLVGERIGWLLAGRVNLLSLSFPPGCQNNILSVRLINGERLIPTLLPEMVKQGTDGVCRPSGEYAAFSYDASKIPGAKSVVVEISGPRRYFVHYTFTLRDDALSKYSLRTIPLSQLTGRFELARNSVPTGERFEVRIAALASDRRVLGTVSDPVIMEMPRGASAR